MGYTNNMDIKKRFEIFGIPAIVLVCLILFIIAKYQWHNQNMAYFIAIFAIAIGTFTLVIETIKSIVERIFALDYIALLAIGTAVYTHEYLVALVIVLMLSGGNSLEAYATARAKKSLTSLVNRIPTKALLWHDDKSTEQVNIEKINIGDKIAVRRGEVIPLDGVIFSGNATIDESSLTGEPYTVDKSIEDTVRSGTINVGDTLIIQVTKNSHESTYAKIIELVQRAEAEKAPIVRLANRYSGLFTIITLILCTLAYYISHDIHRVLAVLVVATPCPLILATPIALFGGMNKSAAKNILIKNPASLERLNSVTDIVFDKTGTVTVGKPIIENLEIVNKKYEVLDVYTIAEAIERNSLHPYAKAIVSEAHRLGAPHESATNVHEQIGLGIFGTVGGTTYTLSKSEENKHSISLLEGSKLVAHFMFEDKIKDNFGPTFTTLRQLGLSLHIFTGDKAENTKNIAALVNKMNSIISITSDMKPEEKESGVKELKSQGKIVAMIGDGINDAPALAIADIGMVFSNEEQTASSEAADIVLLQGNLDTVISGISIAHRTIKIALQSIIFGIALSVIAMILSALGFIPPIAGALLQEVIDILVIFNALRASI